MLFQEETSNLTTLINGLDNDIGTFTNEVRNTSQRFISIFFSHQSNANSQALFGQANSIGSSVNRINSSCLSALANISSQNASIEGLNFDAEIRNVGFYSDCTFEYIETCNISTDANQCNTSYHNILVEVCCIPVTAIVTSFVGLL